MLEEEQIALGGILHSSAFYCHLLVDPSNTSSVLNFRFLPALMMVVSNVVGRSTMPSTFVGDKVARVAEWVAVASGQLEEKPTHFSSFSSEVFMYSF